MENNARSFSTGVFSVETGVIVIVASTALLSGRPFARRACRFGRQHLEMIPANYLTIKCLHGDRSRPLVCVLDVSKLLTYELYVQQYSTVKFLYYEIGFTNSVSLATVVNANLPTISERLPGRFLGMAVSLDKYLVKKILKTLAQRYRT